ncbi:MAG TPA: dihydroorotase family protein [Candidatus Lokiarchaeia archaeon]|nr:dihydroorotase family protein [Candidatus Lokiarchaeia archaeon]
MSLDINIKNGSYYDPADHVLKKGTIGIRHGQIVSVNEKKNVDTEITIDASDALILPGFIDVHAHLRDLDLSYKETFASGTRAAIHGGVTTLLCMPNTKPAVTRPSIFIDYINRARSAAYCNVGFLCGYPVEQADLKLLKDYGAFGIKLYLERSLEGLDWSDDRLLEEALQNIFEIGFPLHVHPGIPHSREEDSLKFLELVQKQGFTPLQAFSLLYSDTMETASLERLFQLTSKIATANPSIKPRIHACHVSSALAIDKLLSWKERFPGTITSEVTPHHLFLTNEMQFDNDVVAKVQQPLRPASDATYLLQKFLDGSIDMIVSDHAPHTAEEKMVPFIEAPSGFPVLDIYVPLLLTCFLQRQIPISEVIRGCCEAPAAYLGVASKKGLIKKGADADLIIVRQVNPYTPLTDNYQSQSRISPYESAGLTLEWEVTHVIVNGELQIEDGVMVGQPNNRLLLNRRIPLK